MDADIGEIRGMAAVAGSSTVLDEGITIPSRIFRRIAMFSLLQQLASTVG